MRTKFIVTVFAVLLFSIKVSSATGETLVVSDGGSPKEEAGGPPSADEGGSSHPSEIEAIEQRAAAGENIPLEELENAFGVSAAPPIAHINEAKEKEHRGRMLLNVASPVIAATTTVGILAFMFIPQAIPCKSDPSSSDGDLECGFGRLAVSMIGMAAVGFTGGIGLITTLITGGILHRRGKALLRGDESGANRRTDRSFSKARLELASAPGALLAIRF